MCTPPKLQRDENTGPGARQKDKRTDDAAATGERVLTREVVLG